MPGSVIKAAPEQLRREQDADRVVLRDLRRTADVLRETGSAKNFVEITEQDWSDGDLDRHCWSCKSQSEATKKSASFRHQRDEQVTQARADAAPQDEQPTSADSGDGDSAL